MARIAAFAALVCMLLAVGAAGSRSRDQIPPANARPLSEVVRSLEDAGHTVITEIRFDDWTWIARVYKAGLEFEIRVDPVTGEIQRIRPLPGTPG